MLDRIKHFLERDCDITAYDEWHYIFICLKESIDILSFHFKMKLYQTPDDYLYNLKTSSSSEAKKLWRQSIKEKWNYECAYCGSEDNLTLDHITPRSKGGSERVTNILCACHSCNQSKGHQMWSDWYLQQAFFTTERLGDIIEWQKQINDNEYQVYRPRKNVI